MAISYGMSHESQSVCAWRQSRRQVEDIKAVGYSQPSKHEIGPIVGPSSTTLAQQQTNVGPMSHVCRESSGTDVWMCVCDVLIID